MTSVCSQTAAYLVVNLRPALPTRIPLVVVGHDVDLNADAAMSTGQQYLVVPEEAGAALLGH